jgi:hypothetical protein
VQEVNTTEAAYDATQRTAAVNPASLSRAPYVALIDDHVPPHSQQADGSVEGEQSGPGPCAINTESRITRIVILQVPGCPMVEGLRETVRRALERCKVRAEIEDLVGDYPSPTLLINGLDVTGSQWADCSVCRLDLPTEDQVIAALVRNLG